MGGAEQGGGEAGGMEPWSEWNGRKLGRDGMGKRA